MSFFEKHPHQEYSPDSIFPDQLLGRLGEDYIFQREQEHIRASFPALAELVLPCYKMKGSSPGYDILSFDDDNYPFFIEVKTSLGEMNGFRLTKHEPDTARKLSAEGQGHMIYCTSN